ncbi:hypothetical protein F2Q68_00031406 [Brassica cretica]|uniref:TIR domain-containing protein n=1 Tax=Brassica cretica TaxID=69181 RepID=A0A8S9G8I5_BRACR|nr:hypothetical protein F2Q68_00031406 [Brassica cretica]
MTISSPSNFGSVFLNYRGDQLRYGFVSHLIDAFERYGIMFFIDKDEQRGKDLTNLFVRMKESKIALVIFSSSISRSPSFGNKSSKVDVLIIWEPGEVTRPIDGGTQTTLSISELAFPDKFAESLRVDAEAAARKNALMMEYEDALQNMALDLKKAEEMIKIKEAGLEAAKKEKHDRDKEFAAERGRYSRERRQAIQADADLEEELETVRSKISWLEVEKVEELEKTKRAMDRMRQSRNRELLSERSCVVVAANRRFEKFRKYIVDRDEKEERRLFHGTALGTLDALSLLEKKGLSVPQQLKDLLTANEAKFKEEVEKVSVEVITERDLALSPPRRDLLLRGNQFGSNFGTVDSDSATAFRSPVLRGESSIAASDPAVACQSTVVTSEGRAVTPDSYTRLSLIRPSSLGLNCCLMGFPAERWLDGPTLIRYAESSWCMDELVNIKKRAEKGKLEVIPIFYKVRAKDVRAQTGKFGDKFWALEKVSSGDQIKKWKDALECISNKMGLSLRDKRYYSCLFLFIPLRA